MINKTMPCLALPCPQMRVGEHGRFVAEQKTLEDSMGLSRKDIAIGIDSTMGITSHEFQATIYM